MGQYEIIGVEAVEGKLALEIFRAGAQWSLAEQMERQAECGSPQLALGLTRLAADQLHRVARPCEQGVTQIAKLCGMTPVGVRAVLRKLKVRALTEIQDESPWIEKVGEVLPLRLGAGMVLTTEGSVGRELQSEVEVHRILPLPNWLQRQLEKETEFPISDLEMETEVPFLGEKETEFPFPKAKKPEKETEDHHVVISTSLTKPKDPTYLPEEGGLAGRGEESLFQALKPYMSVAKAKEAAKISPDTQDPERLAQILEGIPLLDTHYGEIAEREGFHSVPAIFAHRVKTGRVFDDLLELRRRMERMRLVEAPPSAAASTPRPTQPECDSEALAAWHSIRGALRESLEESAFQEWIDPLICFGFKNDAEPPVLFVGCVKELHRDWIEDTLGDELQTAIAASGIKRLQIEILTEMTSKIAL